MSQDLPIRRQLQLKTMIVLDQTVLQTNFDTLGKYIEQLASRLRKVQLVLAKSKDEFDLFKRNTARDINDAKKGVSSSQEDQSLLVMLSNLKDELLIDMDRKAAITLEQAHQDLKMGLKSLKNDLLQRDGELKDQIDQNHGKLLTALQVQQKNITKVINTQLTVNHQGSPQQVKQLQANINIMFQDYQKLQEKLSLTDKGLLQVGQKINDTARVVMKKADHYDINKLEQKMLETVQLGVNTVIKRCADREQTKKALMFLEKRVNKYDLQQQAEGKDPMFTFRNLKCVSCAADLGEAEGKLDKYKPWAIFPSSHNGKQASPSTPQKQHSSLSKKRQYSSKKELQESALNVSKFQNTEIKRSISRSSRRPSSSQTNFMMGFGRAKDNPVHLRQGYERVYNKKT